MPITVDQSAPAWAHQLASDINADLERLQARRVPLRLPTYVKADLPSASTYSWCWIYVSDEAGGATPAFSDGSAWRRAADRAVVS
jgi:hypothetical protein